MEDQNCKTTKIKRTKLPKKKKLGINIFTYVNLDVFIYLFIYINYDFRIISSQRDVIKSAIYLSVFGLSRIETLEKIISYSCQM